MATRSSRIPRWIEDVFRFIAAFSRRMTEPSVKIEPKQRRRVRLLTAFLLLMTLNSLAGSMTLKNTSGNSWLIMVATSAAFLFSYCISRTRYYQAAIILALVIPAVPPLSIAILKPTEINLTAELMWLSLPLMISSLMLTAQQTIIMAFSYISFFVILKLTGYLETNTLTPLIAYILIVTFIVAAIATIRRQDQAEIENQLAERLRAEKTLRESESKYRSIFESANDIIILFDYDGNITDINNKVKEIAGYEREDLIGHNLKELTSVMSQSVLATAITNFNKRVAGSTFPPYEVEMRKKNGEPINIEINAVPLKINDKVAGDLAILRDVTLQKRSLLAIKESEEKFSKAFNASPVLIAITTQDGIYIDVNDSYTFRSGYSREELIGHTALSVNIWANKADRLKMIKMYREQEKIRNEEFEFRMKSGEIRTWLFSLEPITISGEQCFIGVSTDITERKSIEKALRDSEDKFSRAFHAIPEAVSISTLKDGIFLDVNDSFLVRNGYTREEVIGHKAKDINLWADAQSRDRMQQMMQEHGRFENEEFEFQIKTGEKRTVLLSAETITASGQPCLLVLGNDITEHKLMEQSLKESEEKFSKAFSSSPNAISIVSIEEDKFIEVNESFFRFTGYNREEVIGRNSAELDLWVNQDEFEHMTGNLQEKGSIYNQEYRSRTKSGEIRVGLFSANQIIIGGKPCVILVITDITDQKQAEEKLKAALADLERSTDQLEATNTELESFSYSVSHDLRSPLRSIDGFSQALLEDYATRLDETGRDYLNRLRSASQKMGELIDGLLKLSRLTRSEMHLEEVDLSALAGEISTRLQETHPENRVKLVIDSGLRAEGDPQLLRALLENLLGNAWKFTSKTPDARIEFGSTRNGGERAFFIKDNGAGFDMAYKDKLFRAFQRLHDTTDFPGTGIGLATVQRIINRHGGIIRAEGAVGKGAAFYFTLS